MRAMFSQPTAGIPEDQIISTSDKAIEYLESMCYEVVNTLFTDK